MSHHAETIDAPVSAQSRLEYLDVLRGFAIMAIFVVNIKGMAMPFAYYMNPSLWATELETGIAYLQKFLIDDKWRTNFTALFGAGLVLIAEKSRARGASGTRRLLTRNSLLLVFGLIHLLFIWAGDILVTYALAGFLAIWFRGLSTVKLIIWAAILLVIGTMWASLFGAGPAFEPELRAELEPIFWGTNPDILADDISTMRGSIADQNAARLEGAIGFIGFYYLLGGNWMITLGLMVSGMALFKSGFYKGLWSVRTTTILAILFLGMAWGLDAYQINVIIDNDYDYAAAVLLTPLSIIDGYLGAFGFAALVSTLLNIGIHFRPVAAVGRMAFSNYILCSLIGTTLAATHGLGWYGQASLGSLMAVVGLTWLGMLIWSPIWLSIFRFGPLEWLWRSLTYMRPQYIFRERNH